MNRDTRQGLEETAGIRKSIPVERMREAAERTVRGDFSAFAELYEETGLPEYADPYYWHRFQNAETATEKVQVLDEWVTKYPTMAPNYPWYRRIERIIPSLREAAKREQEASRSQDTAAQPSERLRRGKLCEQVVGEIKRIRTMCVDRGRTVAEMKKDYPGFHVWKVVEELPEDDRETFQHPKRWGPVVGYAHGLLAKQYGKSVHTINDLIKDYRHFAKQQQRQTTLS